MVIGMLPPLQAWRVARANDVELSLRQYLFGASEAHGKVEAQAITYATIDGQALKLDAYLPAGAGEAATRRAAIIVVHGGSWNGGEKSDFPQWDRWLNEQGYAVFDVEYRLAP